MAEKKEESVAEEVTEQVEETPQKEQVEEKTPEIDLSKFDSADDPEVVKIDMSKPPKTEEDAVQEQSTDEVSIRDESDTSEKVVEEVIEEPKEEITREDNAVQNEETPLLEEVTSEEVEEVTEQVEEAIAESKITGEPLPENVQKLVDFINETGGDINDYVKLNQDYSKLDNQTLLYEYYKNTKPHLSSEEINFLMEDQFSYDEEVDEARDIKRKKLALKEQVASAKTHLDGLKSKYYEDIKAGSKLTSEQQKAIDFFNRYNQESETADKLADTFIQKTDEVFSNKFKGFEYNVGNKKYRFNVKNTNEVKENQSDINNFVKKFLNKDNEMSDAKGYHKSLFTAMNADAIANHFYEQGKADAIKESIAKGKNVSMEPRQSHGQVSVGGVKYRVLGDSSSDFKFKIKNNK